MGNSQSNGIHSGSSSPSLFSVCNILPDAPSFRHRMYETNADEACDANRTPHPVLDRRFDLDIAPSMLNMNLEWNGAYVVAAALYDVIFHKYGCKYLISTQALHWKAICRMYRLKTLPPATPVCYRLTLSALLETASTETICSEKEFSIYTEYPPTTSSPRRSSHHASTGSNDSFEIPTAADGSFYKMAYYYMPSNKQSMMTALKNNHPVVGNVTVFTNFLKCTKGNIVPPTDADDMVGMLAILVVGYDHENWIVRFPFGMHWGDEGVGYISFQYFERYSRDRWVVDVEQFRCADGAAQGDGDSQLFSPLNAQKESAVAEPDTRSHQRRKTFF
jgi:hypothetical protein